MIFKSRKSCADGTDVVGISEMFDNFLAGEIDRTVTRTEIQYDNLKPSCGRPVSGAW